MIVSATIETGKTVHQRHEDSQRVGLLTGHCELNKNKHNEIAVHILYQCDSLFGNSIPQWKGCLLSYDNNPINRSYICIHPF